jgi:hypothetical protein
MSILRFGLPFLFVFCFLGLADAGYLGSSFSHVEVGNLQVTDAQVVDQTWKLSPTSVTLELQLKANAPFKIALIAFAASTEEYEQVQSQKNEHFEIKPQTEQLSKAEVALTTSVSDDVTSKPGFIIKRIEATAKPRASGSHDYLLTLSWAFPTAGDGYFSFDDRPFLRRFCLDKGTQAALYKKKADGYFSLDFRLSKQSQDPIHLEIIRQHHRPISLCASHVTTLNENVLVSGRANLHDQDGLLPILFADVLEFP